MEVCITIITSPRQYTNTVSGLHTKTNIMPVSWQALAGLYMSRMSLYRRFMLWYSFVEHPKSSSDKTTTWNRWICAARRERQNEAYCRNEGKQLVLNMKYPNSHQMAALTHFTCYDPIWWERLIWKYNSILRISLIFFKTYTSPICNFVLITILYSINELHLHLKPFLFISFSIVKESSRNRITCSSSRINAKKDQRDIIALTADERSGQLTWHVPLIHTHDHAQGRLTIITAQSTYTVKHRYKTIRYKTIFDIEL